MYSSAQPAVSQRMPNGRSTGGSKESASSYGRIGSKESASRGGSMNVAPAASPSAPAQYESAAPAGPRIRRLSADKMGAGLMGRAVEKMMEMSSPRAVNSDQTSDSSPSPKHYESAQSVAQVPERSSAPPAPPRPVDGLLFSPRREAPQYVTTSSQPTNGNARPQPVVQPPKRQGASGSFDSSFCEAMVKELKAASPVASPKKAPPAETAIVPAGRLAGAVSNVRSYVEDKAVVVYGQVENRVVLVRTKISDSTEAAKAKALETYQKVQEMMLAGNERTKAELKKLQLKALEAGTQVKVSVVSAADRAQTKALALGAKVPVPVKLQNSAIYLRTKVGEGVVFVKDGSMRILARVGDVTMQAKVRGIKSVEGVKSFAAAEFAKAMRVVQLYDDRLKSGLAVAKGKVGNTLLSIKARVDKSRTKALEAGAKVWKSVEAMPVTKKLMNGVSVVQSKATSATVYVKDGYVHAVTKVNNQYVYTRAQIVKRGGTIKLKVLETYASTEARVKSVLDEFVAKTLSKYNQAKAKSLTAVEFGKEKAVALADYSKTVAADKPVRTSAASGAVLLGTGGGVAGMAAGSLAGAAAGLPMALFTFGLSIPVGAVVGGSAGAFAGAVTGGTAGAVGGGAAGYGFEHREQIKSGVESARDSAVERAAKAKDYVKETAVNSRDSVTGVVARLRGSTGGSA